MFKKMPIDIGKLIKSASTIGEDADLPVYVDIVYDAGASDALITCIHEAFSTVAINAFVDELVIDDSVPKLSLPADLCIIVGGRSPLLADAAFASSRRGIATVVVCEKGHASFSKRGFDYENKGATTNLANISEHTAEHGIAETDLISIDLASNSTRPLEELGLWIVRNLEAKRLSFAAYFEFLRHPLADELVISSAIQNGAIGLVFFMPGADMPLITLNQAKMVLEMATIYGKGIEMERAKEIAAVVIGAYGCRGIARLVAGFVPGWAGVLVKCAVAFGGTWTMGKSALDYYSEGGTIEGLNAAVHEAASVADKTRKAALERVFVLVKFFSNIALCVTSQLSNARAASPNMVAASETFSHAVGDCVVVAKKLGCAAIGFGDISCSRIVDALVSKNDDKSAART